MITNYKVSHHPFAFKYRKVGMVIDWRTRKKWDTPKIVLKEHIYQSITCYERVVILGRANSWVKYFPSSEVAKEFKGFIYSHSLIQSDLQHIENLSFRNLDFSGHVHDDQV